MLVFWFLFAVFNYAGAWTWCALYVILMGQDDRPLTVRTAVVMGFVWPLVLVLLLIEGHRERKIWGRRD